MCVRYYNRAEKQEIARRVKAAKVFAAPYVPNFNIAPTTYQPVVRMARDTDERELELMRWGLVPFFAKSLAEFKGFSTFNAKAETLTKSPTWRTPLKKRRCIVPIDGFYEWKTLTQTLPSMRVEGVAKKAKAGSLKQPFAITHAGGGPLFLAGLWDAWREPKASPNNPDTWLQSFSIITVEANELMLQVHDRMPAILDPRDFDEWLDRDDTRPAPVHLLRPYDPDAMQLAPCNPAVGNVRNNGPEMLICPAPGTLPLNSA